MENSNNTNIATEQYNHSQTIIAYDVENDHPIEEDDAVLEDYEYIGGNKYNTYPGDDNEYQVDDEEEYEDETGVDKTKKEQKIRTEYNCFTIEGNDFYPSKKTTDHIPSGYYKIRKEYSRGLFLRKQDVNIGKLVVLENCKVHGRLLSEMDLFWKSKEEYLKRGKVYKKNILLHSAPGMGKTSLINLIIKDLISKRDGIVISLSESQDIINFNDMMMYIKAAMPNRPIIAIIEDFDNFGGSSANNSELETELLNILDGNQKYDNLVVIATTNYPENLTERYINRPSRFNTIIEYPYPEPELRREFLVKTNLKEDIEKIDIDKWVEKTEGYTTDYLNELSMAVFINHMPEDEAFEMLDTMRNTKVVKYKNPNRSTIGLKMAKNIGQ